MLRPNSAIFVAIAFTGAVAVVVWRMRRLSLRAQLLTLLALGASVGFLLMIVVQLPAFPQWLAGFMVLVVFIASPFVTREFLRTLKHEEQDQANELEK